MKHTFSKQISHFIAIPYLYLCYRYGSLSLDWNCSVAIVNVGSGETLRDQTIDGIVEIDRGAIAQNLTIVSGILQIDKGAKASSITLGSKATATALEPMDGLTLTPGSNADLVYVPYSPSASLTYVSTSKKLVLFSDGKSYTFQISASDANIYYSAYSDYGIPSYIHPIIGTDITVSDSKTIIGLPTIEMKTQVSGQKNIVNFGSGTLVTNGGPNSIMLGGGACTVQSMGMDTIYGGSGRANVAAAGGAVVIGGTGYLTFLGGSATSTIFVGKGGLGYTGSTAYDIVVGNGNAMTVQGGSGGGQYWGSGDSTITAGTGSLSVLVGQNGDKLYSAGAAGNFLVAISGDVLLSGAASTGNDVLIGASAGNLTFIAGAGDVLMGLGTGANNVTLGAGHDTVFARGDSTITTGSGSADIALLGQANLLINSNSAAGHSFALFNFIPGADRITLTGFDSAAVGSAISNQTNVSGSSILSLEDGTKVTFFGVSRVDASIFS